MGEKRWTCLYKGENVNALSAAGTVRANDIDIHYRTDGTDGPWAVLAHALGVDHRLWDNTAQRLAGRYRVLRYDARGHGQTSAPHGPYTLFQMADDVAGLLDALSIGQVHFVGLSMGGMVGQVLGVRHAQRLLSLAREALEPTVVCKLAAQTLAGLHAAHEVFQPSHMA